MSDCCTETVTVEVQYFVRVSTNLQETGEQFGPVKCYEDAKALLLTVSARSDVKKATIEKEQL